MIVTTAQLYKVAYGKFAVGAYNINNMEQVLGLFRGCIQSKAPFIIQLSKGARAYADKRMLEAMIRAAEVIFPDAIFAVHLDHGDEASCYDCIDSGFYSSVMIDASHESFDNKTRRSPNGWLTALTQRESAWRPNWANSAGWKKTSRWMKGTPA